MVLNMVGRCFVPRESHADPLRESSILPPPDQDECGCTPEGPAGRPVQSADVRQRYGPIPRLGPCHQPLTALFHPSQLTGGNQGYFWCGSPRGLHPRHINVAE